MIRKLLLGLALTIVVLIAAAMHLMNRVESQINRDAKEQLEKLPPKVVKGERLFAKKVFYNASGLGEITQIVAGWPANREDAALTLLGKNGASFLDANATLKKQIVFATPSTVPLEVVHLDGNGDYGFLSRDQSWGTDVELRDKSGAEVWGYPGGVVSSGVDDATGGLASGDGGPIFVVGFNGDRGLAVVNAMGQELWQRPEGNVWHVETLDVNGDGQPEILHTNARGELLVRTAKGEILGQYLSGYYVSDFSLTRWADETYPTHILVPTSENEQGCCKNVFLVLDSAGKVLADWNAPEGKWIHRTRGTSVRLSKNEMAYAVIQTGVLPRTLLSIFNGKGEITYQEVLGDRCLALSTLQEEAAGQLLVGCTNEVWQYFLATRP